MPDKEFWSILPEILEDFQNIFEEYGQSETFKQIKKALEYNFQNANMKIAHLTIRTYEELVLSQKIASPNRRLAYILAWCAEIYNVHILILDDIIDNGEMRRGLACWHRLESVGLNAITHSFMLEQLIYVLVQKHVSHLKCYTNILQLFRNVTLRSGCGKDMDSMFCKKSVAEFKRETYNTMAVNKGTYYNFYLPFALAMNLAGFTDPLILKQCMDIFYEIGLYFQIQNDFLDCFGNLENSGKIGTDIQDNKFSWLAVTCMELANEEQRQLMMDCYGSKDPKKVENVKELYKTLDLPSIYADYEKESYEKSKTLISQLSNGVPHEIFVDILNKIHQGPL
ncbi:farnesyl pyrophosphate synthase-like [Musca autumnalis]|uniref:farnesyl pyrophosphate synthase-like n=1 Tax=Musca autumnalis TaxID=221902 RepID=UPI003CE8AD7F